ncbi:MAG: hypothetical protein RL477_900 [Pseudomonadota bacterium]
MGNDSSKRSNFRRLPGRALASFALVLLLAGCAGIGSRSTPEYRTDAAQKVFARAYENIFDKYIEALATPNFAMDGIAGLSSIDESLGVRRRGPHVLLTVSGTEVARFPAPEADNIEAWARLTTNVIDAGRERSVLLKAAMAEDIYTAVLNAAVSHLDRHSRYAGLRSARDSRAQREGFGGVGIRLNFDRGLPEIITVMPDTPAEHSDLKAGDIIIEVDGAAVAGLDRDAIVWRLRGEVGSEASLLVRRKDAAEPVRVSVRRALIVSQTVHLRKQENLAVITLTGFNQRTARNLNRTLETVSRMRPRPAGIVLDLRGNPGGLLDQAVAVADSFLDRGRIVSTRGRHPDSYQVFNANGRDRAPSMPLAVLINGQSASAAEIVAAALQDQGRAILIGSNSYGKGTVQNITRLPNDGELVLTWSRFHAPSGYALENLGVMPNFCSTVSAAGSRDSPIDQQALDVTIVLAAWRAHSGYDAASAKGLRERCPRRSEKPDQDIEIAARVLSDRSLYARAVGASVPAVARRRDQGATLH